MKFQIAAIAKLGLSVGLIWYSISRVDLSDVVVQIPTLAPGWVACTVALVLAQWILGSLRYQKILSVAGIKLSQRVTFDAIMIGAFFSQTLASFIGGDAMRMWRISRAGVPLPVAAYTVVIDRIFGFLGLTALIALGLPRFLGLVQDSLIRSALFALVASVVLACIALSYLPDAPSTLVRGRAIRAFVGLGKQWRAQFVNYGSAVALIVVSTGIQGLNVLTVYTAALSLNVEIDLGTCMALIPPVLFLAMLPISFAGWGIRESTMVLALGLVGISPLQSVTISICYGLTVLVTSLPGGIFWLRDKHAAGEDLRKA